MQVQYKFYRIDKDAVSITLPLLSNYKYEKVNNYIVAIQYDYLDKGYKDLLEYMSDKPVSQYIFTTSIFYKLLTNLVERNIDLYEIKLNMLFEEDNDEIMKLVQKINKNIEKEKTLNDLLDLLKWFNYDEGIDISYMTFGLTNNNQRCRFHFYNNGVVTIDSDKIIVQVFDLLRSIIWGG